ncbi:MAG: hypothetical protein MUO82_10220 [Candidatus Thermoplasmatota archaeon]|nr:hypothetical protein [Candidatus Thermoplasmatota archaeon]
MRKIAILLTFLMLVSVGFLSGCNKKTAVNSYKDQILGKWGASDYWIQFNEDNTCYTYSSTSNDSTQYTYSITDKQIIFSSQGSIIYRLSYTFIGNDKLQITTEQGAIYTLPRFIAQTDNTNIKPSCSLSVDINSGNSPLTVNFLMSASDTDGSISFWVLDINNDGYIEYSGLGNPPLEKNILILIQESI